MRFVVTRWVAGTDPKGRPVIVPQHGHFIGPGTRSALTMKRRIKRQSDRAAARIFAGRYVWEPQMVEMARVLGIKHPQCQTN